MQYGCGIILKKFEKFKFILYKIEKKKKKKKKRKEER